MEVRKKDKCKCCSAEQSKVSGCRRTYIDPFYVSLFPYRHDAFTSNQATEVLCLAASASGANKRDSTKRKPEVVLIKYTEG